MTSSLLDRILKPRALSVRFQPICEITSGRRRVDSLEGLIRGPKGTNFERADILFDYVRRKRAEAAVDRRCIGAICREVADLPHDFRINLNVHASTLGHSADFVDFFRRQARNLSLPLERFTLEIVEHSPSLNIPGLMRALQALRDLGVRIALDDVGLGSSNYQLILDCRPDYFKLDAFFVRGVSYDPDRQAVVKSVMCLAEEMKGVVVAEGVATNEDLSTLSQMGIKLFQAHLVCPPMTSFELLQQGIFSERPAPAMRCSSSPEYQRAPHRLLPLAMG
jgi:EAL domain-containing protein (putative c-di-GMP-specific phosphodiesterase class I)